MLQGHFIGAPSGNRNRLTRVRNEYITSMLKGR